MRQLFLVIEIFCFHLILKNRNGNNPVYLLFYSVGKIFYHIILATLFQLLKLWGNSLPLTYLDFLIYLNININTRKNFTLIFNKYEVIKYNIISEQKKNCYNSLWWLKISGFTWLEKTATTKIQYIFYFIQLVKYFVTSLWPL